MSLGALPAERVSPYVRALVASLQALAPDDVHVPLVEAVAHLQSLDPALSGEQLAPAELSWSTGMPAYPWLERAISEQVIAMRDLRDPADAEMERAVALDPALGRRMRDRRDLRRHLRAAAVLPAFRLRGAVRRLDPIDAALIYDRLAPDGRWVRIRVEARVARGGPLHVDANGRLLIDELVQHAISRQFNLPLDAMVLTLSDLLQGEVLRLSRGWLGPFWFPGVDVAPDVPAELFSGLLLHASTEVVGEDVRGRLHHDPWLPQPSEQLPASWGSFRERRFAATGRVVEPGAQVTV